MRIKYNDSYQEEEWDKIFDQMMEEYTKYLTSENQYMNRGTVND